MKIPVGARPCLAQTYGNKFTRRARRGLAPTGVCEFGGEIQSDISARAHMYASAAVARTASSAAHEDCHTSHLIVGEKDGTGAISGLSECQAVLVS